MKRSLQVSAPLVAATAVALLTGCRKPEMQRCVDEHNRVVDPSFCRDLPPNAQPQNSGGGVFFFPYHYYYGGGGGWNLGEPVYGGSYVPQSGHRYTTSSSAAHSVSSTARGGFGSTHGESSSSGSSHGSASSGS